MAEPYFMAPSDDPSIDNSEIVECMNLIKYKFMHATPEKMRVFERLMENFDMKSPDWVRVWFDRGVMNVTPGPRLLAILEPKPIIGPEDKDLVS